MLAVLSYFGFRLTYVLQLGMLGKRKYIEPNYSNKLRLAMDCDSSSRRKHFYKFKLQPCKERNRSDATYPVCVPYPLFFHDFIEERWAINKS